MRPSTSAPQWSIDTEPSPLADLESDLVDKGSSAPMARQIVTSLRHLLWQRDSLAAVATGLARTGSESHQPDSRST